MSQGQWFAVAAKPRQEHVGEVYLKRQGYPVVVTLIEARKRRLYEWTMVAEPFFQVTHFVRLE